MTRFQIGLSLQLATTVVALVFRSVPAQAQQRSVGELTRPFSVTTNEGRVIERYGTPGNLAIVQYPEITNDVPMLQAVSTNVNGHVFDCFLMASQLKDAPKWDPEKTVPPLSPKHATSIAMEQALKDLGPSAYNIFDFEASHHWSVVDVSLIQSWGWWDRDFVWYYRIGVKRHVNGSSPGIPDAQIFVTMDGKAAPYTERKTNRRGER